MTLRIDLNAKEIKRKVSRTHKSFAGRISDFESEF